MAFTKDFTFAEISYPFLHIFNALEKKAIQEKKRIG
jgi:hypothetical protein